MIIQDIIDRNRIIKESNVNSLTLSLDRRGGDTVSGIEVEGIAAIDDQLAILKVSDTDVQPLCFNNDDVQIGDIVYVLSSPGTFSQGVISSIFSFRSRTFFQITAPIPDGCNGCPVLNSKGQVIGIAAGINWLPGGYGSIGRGGLHPMEIKGVFQNPNFVVPAYYLQELLSKVGESS